MQSSSLACASANRLRTVASGIPAASATPRVVRPSTYRSRTSLANSSGNAETHPAIARISSPAAAVSPGLSCTANISSASSMQSACFLRPHCRRTTLRAMAPTHVRNSPFLAS